MLTQRDYFKQLLVQNGLDFILYLDRIYTKPTFCQPKGIFSCEKATTIWKSQKLWKKVKDEETITELKRKGQI